MGTLEITELDLAQVVTVTTKTLQGWYGIQQSDVSKGLGAQGRKRKLEHVVPLLGEMGIMNRVREMLEAMMSGPAPPPLNRSGDSFFYGPQSRHPRMNQRRDIMGEVDIAFERIFHNLVFLFVVSRPMLVAPGRGIDLTIALSNTSKTLVVNLNTSIDRLLWDKTTNNIVLPVSRGHAILRIKSGDAYIGYKNEGAAVPVDISFRGINEHVDAWCNSLTREAIRRELGRLEHSIGPINDLVAAYAAGTEPRTTPVPRLCTIPTDES
jgi:hypothetical protein